MTGAARYIKIPVFCAETGYTPKAVQRKIEDGVWKSGHQYVKAPDGHILIDLEGYKKWAAGGVVAA